MKLELTVNGERHETDAWGGESLLYVLRERLGLPGSKNACEQGECGSCSVLLDGTLVCACLVLAAQAEGHEVTTVEGLCRRRAACTVCRRRSSTRGRCSAASARPGLVVAAAALLDEHPSPTRGRGPRGAVRQPLPLHRLREDLRRRPGGLRVDPLGHVARRLSTRGTPAHHPLQVIAPPVAQMGNESVSKAVPRVTQTETPPVVGRIGESVPRTDAPAKVKGEFAYSSDLQAAGMLWGHTLRSPHAHARIVSIDIGPALDDGGCARGAHARRRSGPEDVRAGVPRPAGARDRPCALPRRARRRRRGRASGAGASGGGRDRRRLRGARAGRRHGARDRRWSRCTPTGRRWATATATTPGRMSSGTS